MPTPTPAPRLSTIENRPLVVTKANGDAVTYAYDATGQKGLLSTKTDGNSHVTTYSYTNRNQPYITTYPDSTTESWSYDNAGNDRSPMSMETLTRSPMDTTIEGC